MMVLTGLTLLSALIWIVLWLGWGSFWRSDQQLESGNLLTSPYPSIGVIIPARNEADVLPQTLPTLLTQPYPGSLQIVLVDDQSEDGTGNLAVAISQQCQQPERLTLLTGKPLPPGWSGKLWAVEQGWQFFQNQPSPPDYILLTDADIAHGADTLPALVAKAVNDQLALVSLMVQLRCVSFWEKWLIPAFIFFFQKLYPFPWVNNPDRSTAAAAGGCILVKTSALQAIGGISVLKEALIDDCTLAQRIKALPAPIWLGLSTDHHSLRAYDRLGPIWQMVSRTAYTQLHYNPLLLLATLIGMAIVYLVAPVAIVIGVLSFNPLLFTLGFSSLLLMAALYQPTVKRYGRSPLWGLTLPIIGLLYSLMTLDSAINYWRGQGSAWKGRHYVQP